MESISQCGGAQQVRLLSGSALLAQTHSGKLVLTLSWRFRRGTFVIGDVLISITLLFSLLYEHMLDPGLCC